MILRLEKILRINVMKSSLCSNDWLFSTSGQNQAQEDESAREANKKWPGKREKNQEHAVSQKPRDRYP